MERRFRYIKQHVKFLKRACNNCGIHPLDRNDVAVMMDELGSMNDHDFRRLHTSFEEVSLMYHELDLIFYNSTPEGML